MASASDKQPTIGQAAAQAAALALSLFSRLTRPVTSWPESPRLGAASSRKPLVLSWVSEWVQPANAAPKSFRGKPSEEAENRHGLPQDVDSRSLLLLRRLLMQLPEGEAKFNELRAILTAAKRMSKGSSPDRPSTHSLNVPAPAALEGYGGFVSSSLRAPNSAVMPEAPFPSLRLRHSMANDWAETAPTPRIAGFSRGPMTPLVRGGIAQPSGLFGKDAGPTDSVSHLTDRRPDHTTREMTALPSPLGAFPSIGEATGYEFGLSPAVLEKAGTLPESLRFAQNNRLQGQPKSPEKTAGVQISNQNLAARTPLGLHGSEQSAGTVESSIGRPRRDTNGPAIQASGPTRPSPALADTLTLAPMTANRLRGPLQPLRPAAQKSTIHRDSMADSIAHRLQADAVTLGTDIFFRHGRFAPERPEGFALLSHELTHVWQHLKGDIPKRGETSAVPDGLEQQAALMEDAALREQKIHRAGLSHAHDNGFTAMPQLDTFPTPAVAGMARQGPSTSSMGDTATAIAVPLRAAEGRELPASPATAVPDLTEMADQIFRLLERRLQIDKERLGIRRR